MLNYLYALATDERKGFIAGLLKLLLYLLSLIYGLVVRILIFFNRLKPYKIDCKVISVGNITLGGTGKTPLVEYIAKYLKAKGHKVAVLSRGYKKRVTSYQLPVTSYEMMGDEPYILMKNLKDIPVMVNKDRIKAARKAMREYSVDTIILDDGFQQWKIKKDLEIVTIDATCPFGNQHLLPRGILRQPLSTLKRADIFVLTKTNLNPDIQDIKDFLKPIINPQAIIVEAIHKPLGFYRLGDERDTLLGSDTLKNKSVDLVCGIADPDSFENLIVSLGINVGLSFRFPDHHDYREKDLNKIVRETKEKNIDTIITTEKDAVRLMPLSVSPLARLSVFVLRIELKIIQDEIFTQRIHSLY